ncbi:Propionyl-CoA carboxylase beta chain, mitochondrial [Manis javanica]|nr:Propionyl-CoA carboxylase beta chain, mitochondrial [Manis javanica]
MKTAEKFGLPVFTFVDTPGAFPGIEAEERGQSEAIGRNIYEMAQLQTPIITTVIGEGGSGGALAIAVADQVLMLQYAVYSVITPGRLRLHPLEDRRKGPGRGRCHGHHGPPPQGPGPGGQDRQRARGRRPPRPQANGRLPQARAGRCLSPAGGPQAMELQDRRYERLQSYGRFADTKADNR